MEKTSKILITGSGGVLGYGLVNALRSSGYDNLLTPNRNEMDCLNQDSVDDYLNKNRPEYVFHLASLVFGLKGNLDNQLKSISNNTIINQNVIVSSHKFNVKKIFFAGTVASYPFPYIQQPLVEDDILMGEPHDGEYGYAMAKRHALAFLKILKNIIVLIIVMHCLQIYLGKMTDLIQSMDMLFLHLSIKPITVSKMVTTF
ncbi:NAD-dependent epimerase/dehydratase family protein [Dickeya chrysanthemi]|uniref:NAD-dependent epimerase/dehydratase family protein n=1 Tax=Dickeya chrysanthemi TaxID=556 RepID=UPI000587B008|nr:NAD-dependent epimerase/dehydratase family protein [Dickeya chrysanthemi]